MRKNPPVITSTDNGIPEKPARRTLTGSLVGGLIMVTIVAALLVLVSLVSSRGATPATSVGSQPNSYPDALPAGATPLPTATLVPGSVVCKSVEVRSDLPLSDANPVPNQVPPTPTLVPTQAAQATVCSGPPVATEPAETLPPTPIMKSICKWLSVETGATAGPASTANPNQLPPTPTLIPEEGAPAKDCSNSPPVATVPPVATEPGETKPTPVTTAPFASAMPTSSSTDAFARSGSFELIPVTFNTAALSDLLRTTRPVVTFYGAKTDVSTAGSQAIKIVRVSGYSCTDSAGKDTSDDLAKNLPVICTQAGKPDLYLSMSAVYGSFDPQPITPVATGGTPITSAPPTLPRFYCYLNGVAALEKSMYDNGHGYKSSLFIMSGTRLKEAFQNVTNPGAGSTNCPEIK